MAESERRLGRRVPFFTEVYAVDLGARRSSDIGEGGMYLDSVAALEAGNQLVVRFKLADSDPSPIQVRTKVVAEHKGVGMSLAFLDLPEEVRRRISDIVEPQ